MTAETEYYERLRDKLKRVVDKQTDPQGLLKDKFLDLDNEVADSWEESIGTKTAVTAFMATVQALATVEMLLDARAKEGSQAVRLPQGVLDLKQNKK